MGHNLKVPQLILPYHSATLKWHNFIILPLYHFKVLTCRSAKSLKCQQLTITIDNNKGEQYNANHN